MLFLQRVTNVRNFYAKKKSNQKGRSFKKQVSCQVNPSKNWNFLNVGMMSETSRYVNVDSSKRQNDAENLTLLNNVKIFIK